jgi:hypothetical protein
VPSTLGGSQNGHSGLLLSAARYNTLAHAVPWITPVNPGVFVPPNPGTGPQIAAASDVWCELKLQFELCQATDKALIAQLVDSIDPIYLRAMLNRATGQHSGSIRAVVLHLFSAYGKITPQQVKAKEMELYQMVHYDISQPVDTVFNSIDDLSDISENTNSPMTEQQMDNLAYVIFAKQSILQPDLRLWNRRPVSERTYTNLTHHLRDAQADLRSLPAAGDVCHQQPAHQANMATIADLVLQRLLDEQGAELPARAETPSPSEPPSAAPVNEVANSLQRRETDLQSREAAMRTQMQDMMASMLRTHNGSSNNNNNSNDRSRNRNSNRNSNGNNCGQNNSNGNNGQNNSNNNGNYNGQNNSNNNGNYNGNNNNCNNNNSRSNNGNSGGNNGGNNRSQQRFYCHTHGCCAHDSRNCRTPGNSHNTTATFANMLNGSTNGCYWLN